MPQATGYPAAQQQQIAEQPPTAPAVEQSTLPDPISVLDGQLKVLQDSFAQRAQRVKDYGFKKAEEHNYHIGKLQSEYDARKLEIMQVRGTLDTIRGAIDSGHIDPEAGAKAMYGLVFPKDVVKAMYPEPAAAPEEPTRRPFAPSTMEDYRELAGNIAKAAEKDRSYIPFYGGPVPQQELVKQYLVFRQATGYDSSQVTPAEQRQLDANWDAVMRSKGSYQWDLTAPEIKALRTYGDPVLKAAANKVSPMARGLAAQQKQQQKPAAGLKPQDAMIGRTVTRGGKEWRVVGVDTDGTPLVEPAN